MAELLNLFGVDWRLLLIQAINFVVLIAALSYFLYNPILKILDERRKKIEQGIKDAADAKKSLENADEESRDIIGKAVGDAEGIILTAKDSAIIRGNEIVETAQSRASRIEADAKARAEAEAKKALDGSNEQIARVAILGTERLLNKKL